MDAVEQEGRLGVAGVRLVVVFNHRFEANLDKLDRILGDRFPDRLYLMPFYQGDRRDVLPVYASSHRFHDFLVQSRERLADTDASHLVVVADDMVLNPSLDAGNLLAELGLDEDTAYIKDMLGLGQMSFEWQHMHRAIDPFVRETG